MGRKKNPKKVGYADTWEGGFIRYDARQKKTYIIRETQGLRRYQVSTRAHDEALALEHLKLFRQNPAAYSVEAFLASKAPALPPPPRDAVLLTAVVDIDTDQTLCGQFLRWSRDDKHNTPKWVGEQRVYLTWWASKLDGLDLRGLDLRDHILPALEGEKARAPKIAVLKRFYSWLRKDRHLLGLVDDPTFQMLTVPQSNPRTRRQKDKSFPREHYLLAREHLLGHWRDAMDILAGTGWHTTELKRFAISGAVERLPKGMVDEGTAGVLVCPQAKGGNAFRVPVGADVLDAAKRLRARGALDLDKFADAIASACQAAEIKPAFTPGRFRHAVATWAINAGADPAAVAAFLNHRSPSTTKKFYATHAVPKRIPTLA